MNDEERDKILEDVFWRRCYKSVNNRLLIWFNLIRWRLQKTGDGERFRKKIRGIADIEVNMEIVIKMYYVIIIIMGIEMILVMIWRAMVWIMPSLNGTVTGEVFTLPPHIVPVLTYCLKLMI